jgi:glycosyltransferase involved in cell wall biosynthesis
VSFLLEEKKSGENIKISIVTPFFNESNGVLPLFERLVPILESIKCQWEIICVNDGSQDNTLHELLNIRQRDSRVIVVDLSRNFGKEAALTAGLDQANGDVIIPLDADLQDPPEIIPLMIDKWTEGYDVVNAVRLFREGETWFKKLSAYSFYRLINRFSTTEIPPDVGDFRLISRPVLDAIKTLPERRRFMKGIFAWVGFRTTTIPYTRESRFSGKTKWNYWKLWNFALEGITSFSQVPLQLSSYLGFLVSLGAFFYGSFFLIRTLFLGNDVKGYPSLIIIILFLGGVQLMVLGVIGEYLGRTYEETKQRPLYLVRDIWREDMLNNKLQNNPSHPNPPFSNT